MAAVNCPFSLCCIDCDAGTDVESAEGAIQLGWTDMLFAPEMANCNYIGMCPDCLRERIAEDQEDADKVVLARKQSRGKSDTTGQQQLTLGR